MRQFGQHFCRRGKRWLAFLSPFDSTQTKDSSPSHLDIWTDEALPELRQSLRIYETHIIEIGGFFALTGLAIALHFSWIWPFLIGNGIDLVFIGVLQKYRSSFQLLYPLIARSCTKGIPWLLFIEGVTLATLLIVVFGQGQSMHWF